jgi:hypothetical protein
VTAPPSGAETRFDCRPHVRAGLRFFILLVCSAMVAAALFAWDVDPRPASEAIYNLLVPVVVAAIAGALAWRSADVWTAQFLVLGPEGLEFRMGGRRRFLRFDEVTEFSFRHVPHLGGSARLAGNSASVQLVTSMRGIPELLLAVRRRLQEAGRGHVCREPEFRAFLRTAAFVEQRADRYERRYGWFPWLAVGSPVLVLLLARGLDVGLTGAALWTGVFAVYPWLVVSVLELVFLWRFCTEADAAPAEAEFIPPADGAHERRIARMAALGGYYGYLLLNLAMLVRLT